MTDYSAAYRDRSNPYHREAHRLAVKIDDETTIEGGVIRWNSNNSVLPEDCAEFALWRGQPIDLERCNEARTIETAAFIAEYRKANKGRQRSGEEMFEMRAAFGPGVEVVNVFTGDKWRT